MYDMNCQTLQIKRQREGTSSHTPNTQYICPLTPLHHLQPAQLTNKHGIDRLTCRTDARAIRIRTHQLLAGVAPSHPPAAK